MITYHNKHLLEAKNEVTRAVAFTKQKHCTFLVNRLKWFCNNWMIALALIRDELVKFGSGFKTEVHGIKRFSACFNRQNYLRPGYF